MEKVIRISSQQGFASTWTNAVLPQTLNLCDFTIPTGMNVDLSKSYIAFNAEVTNTVLTEQQPMNATMYLEVDNALQINVPVSALIKNCSLSNNRGMVESIRRSDTLNCGLFGLLDNAEDRKNNLNTFAEYEGPRGIGNQTSYFLDAVTQNVNALGNDINLTHRSRQIARDLKIPLNELFGVANSEAYSTDVFGETRIHLETNFQNVKAKGLGGSEDIDNSFDAANTWGAMRATAALPVDTVVGDITNPLVTSVVYDNWQLTCPFFVGQVVIANATATPGTAFGNDVECEILSMQFGSDNTTSPPSGLNAVGRVLITLKNVDGTDFYKSTNGATTLTGITLKAKVANANLGMTINRADLVLAMTDGTPDQTITYETYTTEEDNPPAGISPYNRAYRLEGESTVWMAMNCNTGSILPNRPITSYRYAIDSDEQTGNRDVEVSSAGAVQGSPLQYDRLIRALDHQAGLGFRNAQLKFYENTLPQLTSYSTPVSVIVETAPAKPVDKILNLQIASPGLQELRIYKQVQRTI